MEASTFTHLTRKLSTVLKEMERNNLEMPPAPRKARGHMGRDLHLPYNYYRANDQDSDDCFMLRRDIDENPMEESRFLTLVEVEIDGLRKVVRIGAALQKT